MFFLGAGFGGGGGGGAGFGAGAGFGVTLATVVGVASDSAIFFGFAVFPFARWIFFLGVDVLFLLNVLHFLLGFDMFLPYRAL